MIRHLLEAWRVARPRALAHTHKGVEDLRSDVRQLREELRDFRRSLKEQGEQAAAARTEQTRNAAAAEQRLRSAIDDLSANVNRLALRESQLRAIARRDSDLADKESHIGTITRDEEVRAHVERRFAAASVCREPFPHTVIDQLLPKPLYDALITGLPPLELFADRVPNKRQMTVPFKLGPSYSRRVWSYMARTVVPEILRPAMIEKFRPAVEDWMRDNFPAVAGDPLAGLELNASDGRILLRTRGYVIPPHRDPKWGFLTCLLYLARPGDSPTWGTQLYRVEGDEEARGALPHWVEPNKCREVADIEFVPNRAILFLNSAGAHGSRIPADAPDALERYAYQFRVGPNADGMTALMNTLPEERRAFWAGKLTDY